MAKNEAKIRFTAETSDFNDEIKKSNQTMSELRAEMKLNEEQMRTNGTTVEGLQKKQKILGDQLTASQEKTEALSKKVEKAVEIYGENSNEVSKLRIQLMNAQTAEEKIRQQIQKCNQALDEQVNSASEAEEATESLTDTIRRQEGELSDLKAEYAETVVQYGKNSKEAKGLAKEIKSLSGELKENQYAMSRAEDAADKLDETIEDAGESAEKAGDGFTVFKGTLANLASAGIQAALSGAKDLVTGFLNLAEETKETRTQLALLDNSYDSAGLGAENAKNTLYALQGVLGDTDRATEAANLLAKMSENEADLEANTRILTGVFAQYGASIPTEGLAEGMAATAAMGTVQGVLADALEWQGINLDAFNEKLGTMATEQERAAYIQDTLTGLYGESADAYIANNGALIEANQTQLAYNESLAELGAKSEPITTSLKDGFVHILDAVSGLLDGADFESIGQDIEGAFKWFADEGIPVLVDGVKDFVGWMKDTSQWVQKNAGLLTTLGVAIGVVATGIGAYNVAQGIKAALDAAQVTTIWGLVSAHWAQASAAMAAMAPYILVVAAIAAVIAIIVLCIKYWDDIVAAVKRCWDACCATLATWGTWIDENVIQPVVGFFTGLWEDIVGIFNSVVEWVKTNWQAILLFIVNPFYGAFKYLYDNFEGFRNFVDNIVQKVAGFFKNLWDGFKNGAKNAWEGAKNIFSKVGDFFGNIFGIVKDKIVSVFQAGGKVFNNIKDGIVNVFKTVVNGIITGINKVVKVPFQGLNKILDRIHGVEVAGIKPFSWLTWRATIPEIPMLAKGGILTRPTLNIAGEAGPEAIIPINKLEGYISNAITKAQNAVNMDAIAAAIEDLANRPNVFRIGDRDVAVATASASDTVNGLRSSFKSRGLVLD